MANINLHKQKIRQSETGSDESDLEINNEIPLD